MVDKLFNTITFSHIRGDTLRMKVIIDNYTPIADDTITFALKGNYNDTEYIVVKDISVDDMILYLAPEDTIDLKIADYVFDINIKLSNGDIYTMVVGKIKLINDVYRNEVK